MKKAMFFTTLMVSVGMFMSCNAQNVNVTRAAKKAFSQTYPQVKNPTWEKENGNFEGNWEVSGKDHSALFTPQGKFVGSETEINPSQLPRAARKYIKKYAEGKAKEASLNKDANGKVTYEADVEDGTILFDASGHFLKKGESEEVDQGENSEKNEAYEEGEEND